MLGLRSKASPFQYIAQPNSCPFRIPDRPLLPLRSRNFRAEEGSTIARTLYDCVKRHLFKRFEVRKREREALLDIPFHVQLPVFQARRTRGTKVTPHEKAFVRREPGCQPLWRGLQILRTADASDKFRIAGSFTCLGPRCQRPYIFSSQANDCSSCQAKKKLPP